MKVAIFTDTFLPQINGVTNTLDRLTKYFDANGVEYKLFIPQDNRQEIYQNNIYSFLSFDFFLYPELRFTLPDIFRMKKIIEEFKPDLIHVVTPFNVGMCGLKIAKDMDIPLVASYHTNFSQYLKYYNLQVLDEWLWGFVRWFHNQCLVNYCPSKDTRQNLLKHGINNVEIWGRGIDSKLYNPKNRSETLRERYNINDKLVLLYVGRLAPEKDIHVLIDAFTILNERYKDKIHLIITGSGPVEEELRERKIDNITFTGYLKGTKLAEIYASSDIFVFPSVTETFGNVVLEAMASGLPVVASMEGGVSENLIDGYNGLEALSKNANDYAKKIEKFILNGELLYKIGQNAREHALKQSWDSIFFGLTQSYKKVLDSIKNNFNKSA